MSDMLNPANYNLIARSFDSNKNGILDELKASPEIKQRVDLDGDGNISTGELAQGLRVDAVEIQNGNLVEGKGLSVSVRDVEDLRQIRRIADNSIPSAIGFYLPAIYNSDTPHEEITKLKTSNSAISSSINDMQASLEKIGNVASEQNNSVSKEISNIVKNTLNSRIMMEVRHPSSNEQGVDQHSNPFNRSNGNVNVVNNINVEVVVTGKKGHVGNSREFANNDIETEKFIGELKDRNDNLASAHKTLENAINSIRREASNLPDVQKTISFVDVEMDKANLNLTIIRNKNLSPTDIRNKVYKLSNEEASKVKGRPLVYGGIGLGVGAAVGTVLGLLETKGNFTKLLATPQVLEKALGFAAFIGVGGLMMGDGIDSQHSIKASQLKDIGDAITTNPNMEDAKLQKEGKFFYEQVLEARSANDFDKANLINQRLKGVKNRVEEITTRTDAIVQGYSEIKEAEKK